MKVIIQIPCYNEEGTLATTLAELPRSLPGAEIVEWLIVDDGSTDRTRDVARDCGVDHIVQLGQNRGLAEAFSAGLKACLCRGADIIVNTDADNQYCAADIPELIRPILQSSADIVIGARPIQQIAHFSTAKKQLQRVGSFVVRAISGAEVPDAPSGFRAISRDAALRVDIFTSYSYTLEMIIQAQQKGMRVTSVPVRVNADLRPSRLAKSEYHYVYRSAQTIIRMFALYRPYRFFGLAGAIPFLIGCALLFRWLYLYSVEYSITGRTHVPSLIAAAISMGAGTQIWILAFVADLLRANRMLLHEANYYIRKRELCPQPDHEDSRGYATTAAGRSRS